MPLPFSGAWLSRAFTQHQHPQCCPHLLSEQATLLLNSPGLSQPATEQVLVLGKSASHTAGQFRDLARGGEQESYAGNLPWFPRDLLHTQVLETRLLL